MCSKMSNHQRADVHDAILSFVATSRVSKKEMRKHIKSSYKGQWAKEDIKGAIKQLVSQDKLRKESNQYFIPTDRSTDKSSSDESESEHEVSEEQEEQQTFIPIAQRMRKQPFDDVNVSAKNDDVTRHPHNKQHIDLDEEIKRLEAELAADSASDEDDQISDDSDFDAVNNRKVSFGQNSILTFSAGDNYESTSPDIQTSSSSGVICLSASAKDRIEPLPASSMPQIARKTPIQIDQKMKSKKQKRDKEEHTINEGLKHAVEDLLSNYKTRSEVEQTPWYCRVCQHQANDEAGFLSHRESVLHNTAMKEHQKKTYCKMCRKQMTSVIQFQEHLNSRPHREMLASKRCQQQGRGIGDGRGRRRDGGRDYGRGSKRQWC